MNFPVRSAIAATSEWRRSL